MTEPQPTHDDVWRQLERVVEQRLQERPVGSYVTELAEGGHPVLAGKVVEEAYEFVEACGEGERPNIVQEAADLVFHALILLKTHQVGWHEIEGELSRRSGLGGLTEKALRRESS